MKNNSKKRILIVDDNQDIHADFHKILTPENSTNNTNMDAAEEELFGEVNEGETPQDQYAIDSAYQGKEALELVKQSVQDGERYALAFVDVRMPPGWDGIETIQELWAVDPNIQIVICTAYADYSWKEIIKKLNQSNNYLILKKPFDVIEIRQLVAALTNKWELFKEVQYQIDNLQNLVDLRTSEVQKTLSLTRATLESTPEGIIVIGRDYKAIIYNKVFLDLWDIAETSLKSEKAFTIFQKLAKQVEESSQFLKVMNSLCQKIDNHETIREWKLKNGKILEHITHAQLHLDKIIGTVFCFRDITERKKLESQLLYQATHDSLTGLPNRILLKDRLEQAILHSKRDGTQIGVLLLDLDNFKEINNSLGHGAGDILLKIVSDRLSNSIRDIDTVVRFGGDEFVIILVSQIHPEEVLQKVKEIRELFLAPCEIDNHSLTVTASIGVAFYPHDGEDAVSLIKNADAALYHAKEMGKNTFQVYLKEFNEYLLQRAELLTGLRQALKKNEFVLHYQPLVKSETGKVIGTEALLRWRHPTLGLIYPQSFIPLAEESGLIVSIGEWVLRTACQQTKKWQALFSADLNIAVNISAYQFIQEDFVNSIKRVLKETELNPKCLDLEMTESHIFKNIEETVEKMRKIKDLKVRFSIDDFGTGYASFSYLKYFPFDKVKIDRSFIKGIHINSSDDAIVEAIITMSNKMGIEVLAEGVETSEQINFLLEHHGDQMQGYYYSPPLDIEKCTEFLSKEHASAKTT